MLVNFNFLFFVVTYSLRHEHELVVVIVILGGCFCVQWIFKRLFVLVLRRSKLLHNCRRVKGLLEIKYWSFLSIQKQFFPRLLDLFNRKIVRICPCQLIFESSRRCLFDSVLDCLVLFDSRKF